MTNPIHQAFLFESGPVGCLLIHGFMACPVEMRSLGEYLAERGVTAGGVLLAGHGTTPEEMARTTWRDWAATAEHGLEELKSRCSEVFVAGLSMGGALTLYLAARHNIPAAITFAAAALFKDWRLIFLPLVKNIVKFLPKPEDNDLYDKEAINKLYVYDRIPAAALSSLIEFSGVVRKSLPRVTCPLLIMHGSGDRTVPVESSRYIHKHAASAEKQLIILEKSGHSITVDHDSGIAFKNTFDWIAAHTAFPDTLAKE